MKWEIFFAVALAAGILLTPGSAKGSLVVWSVDPLVKVFRDAAPATEEPAEAHVARGEHASFQLVARASADVAALRVSVGPFTHEDGAVELTTRPARFIGYVHVDRPTQRPSSDQLREPPADYPDVLLEDEEVSLQAGESQPIWIDLNVPEDAAPGLYTAVAEVTAILDNEPAVETLPLTLRVYPVAVGRSRLWMTNWFTMHWPHMEIDPEPDSDAYYALLRRYARNMAEHRQNVALISPLNLTIYGVDDDGELTFDFSRFDRWVHIFREAGVIGRIEGGHIGGRREGWLSPFVAFVRRVENGSVVSERVAPDSEAARTFYSRFFPALCEHLKARGWFDIYMQHLADEPIDQNLDSYRALAALAREYAPGVPIVEATHAKDLVGSIDIWVPQLNYLQRDFEHYRERQQAGEEIWFYTCVFPQGEYANRFIEQPLIKTRLLHWINFRYGATGYLHWGYNMWTRDDPTTHTTRPHPSPPYLPAGDPWIVYPGKDGPLDSIRFEAMRDGVADHELLCMLAERDLDAAHELAARHILDFDRYETDVGAFRATRRALLQALSD